MFDRFDPRDDDRDRGGDRNRGSRGGGCSSDDRDRDPHDVFVRDLDLPDGQERELVRDRKRSFAINGDEARVLATIGAFRVIPEEDLRGCFDRDEDSRKTHDDRLDHLREEGLIQTIPLEGRERDVVVLTKEGRDVLEGSRRERESEPRQAFYAGLRKPRELTHDAQVYRAYCRAEERIRDSGGRVRRVVLDYELKREYQEFLQERNRGREDSDGRPDRTVEEVREWARDHELPYFDEQVHFPDARLEYDDRDGLSRYEDLEIVTEHYRGMHAAGTARSGFTCYSAGSLGSGGFGGSGGGRRGGRGTGPGLAEEMLR
jgi:hypothetical protein